MAADNRYQQGLVSIITPVFKAEKMIEQTIRSVQAQTYKDWEMLLIDDCSPDHSGEIIQKMAETDARIKYHRLSHNSGAAVARNTAIEHAQGAYLAFLDSDDLWTPTKLERQLDFMAEKGCAFSYTRIQMIATSTVVINRQLTGNFSMPLRRGGQDYATWLQLLRTTDSAYGLDECLTSYRTGGQSLSSNKFKSIEQVYTIQTEDEHIGKIPAFLNTLCFCFYAFKKHFL